MMGPYTSDQLKSALSSGALEAGDYGWRQGFREWRALCTVEELALAPQPCLLAPYPSIDLPMVNTAKTTARTASGAPNTEAPEPAKVVRLRRGNHFRMGLFERAGMILFSLGLAYAAVTVALSEVETRTVRALELMTLGHAQSMGEVQDPPLPPEFWAPVFSAPGALKEAPSLPVVVSGVPVPQGPKTWKVGAWTVQGNHVWYPWRADEKGFDPVLVQPVSFHGSWNPAHPERVDVRVPGYPGL